MQRVAALWYSGCAFWHAIATSIHWCSDIIHFRASCCRQWRDHLAQGCIALYKDRWTIWHAISRCTNDYPCIIRVGTSFSYRVTEHRNRAKCSLNLISETYICVLQFAWVEWILIVSYYFFLQKYMDILYAWCSFITTFIFRGCPESLRLGSLIGELFKKPTSFCRQYSILCRMIKLDHIEMQKIT